MNLPNALTLFRMALVPMFAYAYFFIKPTWIALALFLLASATDYLDGYLARRLNQITDFGKLMDPLADKLMMVTMMVCLACTRHLAWWVVIVMLLKELLMMLGSGYMLRREIVVYANIWGKLATVVFVLALALVFPWHEIGALSTVGACLTYLAVALSMLAMVIYAVQAYKNLKARAA